MKFGKWRIERQWSEELWFRFFRDDIEVRDIGLAWKGRGGPMRLDKKYYGWFWTTVPRVWPKHPPMKPGTLSIQERAGGTQH